MNLTEQKVNETISELKVWLDKPLSQEDLTVNGIEKIKTKLDQPKIPKSIINGFESLDNWYSSNFVYDLLTKGSTTYKAETVANGYHILVITDKLTDVYANNPPSLSFDKVGYWLANCVSLRWYNEVDTALTIINKALGTECLDGGQDYKPSVWFIIDVCNRGYGNKIDYNNYNYPQDMGVYQEALDNWDTADLSVLDSVISKLCDFHLDNATFGDGENTMHIQFDFPEWFVYAYEVLAWLSIREKVGLQNPEKFTHPLMNLELNKLPKETVPFPQDELFEKVMSRLNAG